MRDSITSSDEEESNGRVLSRTSCLVAVVWRLMDDDTSTDEVEVDDEESDLALMLDLSGIEKHNGETVMKEIRKNLSFLKGIKHLS